MPFVQECKIVTSILTRWPVGLESMERKCSVLVICHIETDESGVSHPEVPAFLKEETGLLHACRYQELSLSCPLLPGILEVDFEPIMPVPKSWDSSRKSLLRLERMPPMTSWLVDLWGSIDPEGWDGHKSRIFIIEQLIVYSHEVSLGVWR